MCGIEGTKSAAIGMQVQISQLPAVDGRNLVLVQFEIVKNAN
jgi:hypothetical protein